MTLHQHEGKLKKPPLVAPFFLLLILISLLYSRTLNYPWQLDDYDNITRNPAVHLTSIDKNAIKNVFYAAPHKDSLHRPVAYFTFAINWLFAQDDVTGFHLVNIGIHFLTSLFLFLSILLLFRTPNIKGWDLESIYFVALLSSVFWAIHPIQVQAVTYIVQRMTSMAALFYIIAISSYLKARLAPSKTGQIFFFALCTISFALGVGSKNNAIVLPVSLLLLEFLFFRDLAQKHTQKQAAVILAGGVLLVAAAGFFIFLDADPGKVLKGYEGRTFTLAQRLLTQPSIVLFYLSQTFYPIVSRFSIHHDFQVATSFFSPWYTFPALIFILSLIVFALWRIRKNPILSFAILFFFGNHVIESTIISLEMVFEHRNYLPTLFLFLPVTVWIKKAIDYYAPTQKSMYCFLIVSLCAAMMSLGMSTYVRNWDWRSTKALWEDAKKKAPKSARPLQNLAWAYYEPSGHTEKAIEYYTKALDLDDPKKGFRYYSYNNLAGMYFRKLKDYEKALEYSKQALEIVPQAVHCNIVASKALVMLGHYDKAIEHLNERIEEYPNTPDYLYLKGYILLKQGKSDTAFPYFRESLTLSPDKWDYLQGLGVCLTQMGYFERGYWFLKRANAFNRGHSGTLLGLADNRILAGHWEESQKWIQRLIRLSGAENISSVLKKIAENNLGVPFSREKIAQLVAEQISERAEKYNETASSLKEHFKLVK